jgi:FAD-linked oxidoreductase
MSPTGTSVHRAPGRRWRNWAGNASALPAETASPEDVEGVAEILTAAAKAGRRVRPVGSGHSFTPVAATDGVQLRLHRLDELLAADRRTGLVTVQAGMTLHRLCALLADLGLALANLGDIDRQTLAGALATGTHGTGLRCGGLATQVEAMELVLADGSVVTCSATERPELFGAARVGLGAFGVVTAVTLRCEPAYLLRASEGPTSLDDALADLEELAHAHDHVEFYWFPYTDAVMVKRNDRLPSGAPVQPRRRVRELVDDELMANGVYGAACRLARLVPALAKPLNTVGAAGMGSREYTDRSDRVFTSPRRVRFVEMEYAVPRDRLAELVRTVASLVRDNRWPVAFPVEVRVAPPDDVWLSTAYERDTGYVAVHQYTGMPYGRYFREVEKAALALGGRPHWGKLHTLGADQLAERYPRFADVRAVRDEVDPGRLFHNAYLERVLGS